MKKVSPLTSLASILVVTFLLTSIVCSCLSSLSPYYETHQAVVTKKTETSSTCYTQLLCTEKEKEEETDSESASPDSDNLTFIYLIAEPFLFDGARFQQPFTYAAPRSFGNATDIPLFLTKRTFLI